MGVSRGSQLPGALVATGQVAVRCRRDGCLHVEGRARADHEVDAALGGGTAQQAAVLITHRQTMTVHVRWCIDREAYLHIFEHRTSVDDCARRCCSEARRRERCVPSR